MRSISHDSLGSNENQTYYQKHFTSRWTLVVHPSSQKMGHKRCLASKATMLCSIHGGNGPPIHAFWLWILNLYCKLKATQIPYIGTVPRPPQICKKRCSSGFFFYLWPGSYPAIGNLIYISLWNGHETTWTSTPCGMGTKLPGPPGLCLVIHLDWIREDIPPLSTPT